MCTPVIVKRDHRPYVPHLSSDLGVCKRQQHEMALQPFLPDRMRPWCNVCGIVPSDEMRHTCSTCVVNVCCACFSEPGKVDAAIAAAPDGWPTYRQLRIVKTATTGEYEHLARIALAVVAANRTMLENRESWHGAFPQCHFTIEQEDCFPYDVEAVVHYLSQHRVGHLTYTIVNKRDGVYIVGAAHTMYESVIWPTEAD